MARKKSRENSISNRAGEARSGGARDDQTRQFFSRPTVIQALSFIAGAAFTALLSWQIADWQNEQQHSYWKEQFAIEVNRDRYKTKLEYYGEAITLFSAYRELARELRKMRLENTRSRAILSEFKHPTLRALDDENTFQRYYELGVDQDQMVTEIDVLISQMVRVFNDEMTLSRINDLILYLRERDDFDLYDSELQQILRDSLKGGANLNVVYWNEYQKRSEGPADPVFVEKTRPVLDALQMSLERDEQAFDLIVDPPTAFR